MRFRKRACYGDLFWRKCVWYFIAEQVTKRKTIQLQKKLYTFRKVWNSYCLKTSQCICMLTEHHYIITTTECMSNWVSNVGSWYKYFNDSSVKHSTLHAWVLEIGKDTCVRQPKNKKKNLKQCIFVSLTWWIQTCSDFAWCLAFLIRDKYIRYKEAGCCGRIGCQ